jgi:hypothetical protein
MKNKPPLEEVAGKFLHAEQRAPLSPYMIQQKGTSYRDLDPALFELGYFLIKDTSEAGWGWGSYSVAPDGCLKCVHFNYDSSG